MSVTERLLYLAILCIGIYLMISRLSRKKTLPAPPDRDNTKKILRQHVKFYQKLTAIQQQLFLDKVENFLKQYRITGIRTVVEDIDKVFVAASAIIPVFYFDGWEYRNLHEILLYPTAFTEEFQQEGDGRNVLGMVGTGPMQNVMILSQQELRNGFLNSNDRSNTGIHEFVHLIDKTDGATDGSMDMLTPHQYSLPWIRQIHQEIQLIKQGRSDINYYGASSEAEFIAVASEYFFENPQLMEKKHPELYRLLKETFIRD